MKKLIVTVILLLVPALILVGCSPFQKSGEKLIKDELGLDVSHGSVLLLLNTREDGGSGLSYASVAFDDDSFSSQLAANSKFQSLPFSDELTKILYSTEFLVDDNGDLLFPYAENGYYYFDAQLEQDTGIKDPKSADLKIALYDEDDDHFYYCHLSIDNINIISQLLPLLEHLKQ